MIQTDSCVIKLSPGSVFHSYAIIYHPPIEARIQKIINCCDCCSEQYVDSCASLNILFKNGFLPASIKVSYHYYL